jgi:hypothetical protein
MSSPPVSSLEIRGAMKPAFESLWTLEAKKFIAELARRFAPRKSALFHLGGASLVRFAFKQHFRDVAPLFAPPPCGQERLRSVIAPIRVSRKRRSNGEHGWKKTPCRSAERLSG